MKSFLKHYFDRICVVGLPTRQDRQEQLEEHLLSLKLIEPGDIVWYRGISGKRCRAPEAFRGGPGAWGHLHSHIRLIQDAIMEGIDRVLILEDDAVFHSRSKPIIERFFEQLPSDWGQIYFGGQHMERPVPLDSRPFVFRGTSIHGTHAFALQAMVFRPYHRHISDYTAYFGPEGRPIDYQLGLAHQGGKWNTYAPAWWTAGQHLDSRNSPPASNPGQWWHPELYARSLPYIWLHADITPRRKDFTNSLFCGRYLRRGSFSAKGLDRCNGDSAELFDWLEKNAREALSRLKIPGIQHPDISIEDVKRVWRGRVFDAREVTVSAMLDYPFNGLFKHPWSNNREAPMEDFLTSRAKASRHQGRGVNFR